MNNMTVRQKLFAGFGLVLMMMMILTAIGIKNVNFIDNTLTEISDVNSVKQRYAINYRGSVHDRAIDIRDVVLASSNGQLQSLKSNITKLTEQYSASEQGMQKMVNSGVLFTAEETRILSKIDAIKQKTSPQINEIIRLIEQGEGQAAKSLLTSSVSENFKQWLITINQFIDYQENANKIATPLARKAAGNFQYLMIIITSVAILIGLCVAVFISRNLTNQLGAEPSVAAKALANMTEGDLSTELTTCCPKSLMGSVMTMQGKLSAIVSSIVKASGELSIQTQVVASGSRQVFSSAQLQATLTEDATSRLETMREGLMHVSDSVSQSEKISEETSNFAKLGKDKVNESASEMELISSTVKETVGQIKQLESRTKEIGSIVSVISAISEQTNLLALNAAIEAARAGETGRGFAVVADEVRGLALRTSEATGQIETMINQVQSETAASVMAMEKTQPLVENGRSLTIETTDLLLNIEKQARNSLLNVQEVARETHQQVGFVEKISDAMKEINTMSAQSIISLQKNSDITTSLDDLSKELKETVGYFKVN
ncbi:methyl-accepting chemotaxis protein [Psychromonas sp. PT13]|uniref:methyl-accepting chemotaxis protein n=1 Tax=Psychromonas sp. PT13 TaxID=3439547 RepID=UPI003EBB4399